MLRIRVLSSVIGIILLLAAVWSGQIVLGTAVLFIALVGMHEFYNAVSNAGHKPIRTIGYLTCLPIFFIGLNGSINKVNSYFTLFKSINYFSLSIYIMILILFSFVIFNNERYNIIDVSLTLMGSIYVAFLFSFIVLTRNVEGGFYYIWLIFIGAWATDTAAYFAGRWCGRNKVLPAVSPNKTLEGSIGGVVGCVAATVLYGWFIVTNKYVNFIPIEHFVVIGLLNGIIAQIGDWAASAMKRYVKIKDYGSIMPGHGGVLDRFDSILFIAPVVYFYVSFIII